MHRSLRTLFLVLCAGTAAVVGSESPVHAEKFDVSIGSTVRYARSASVDALSADDAHSFFSLVGAMRIDRGLVPGFDLGVEATFETGVVEGTSLTRIDSSTWITAALVGGRLQRRFTGWFTGFARAGVGLSKLSISLEDRQTRAARMSDSAYVATTYVSAGFDVFPMRRRDASGVVTFAIGLRLEAGYVATTSAEMHANPSYDGDEDALRIPTTPASLGTLNASGQTYRVGLVGRF